jgi:3-oxoacyl-[acyl-carrier-protein] synthase III
MAAVLSILGTSIYLPPIRSAREVAATAGADVSSYRGWPNIPVADAEDHPGSMCANALNAALERAGLQARDLALMVSGGMSRDYVPSWSIAAEAMKLCGAPDTCLGVDLTDGCMGGLVAFDFALGWLASRGGGHAAIICAERWTQTVNRADPATMSMWGIGDGAAATVVGIGSARPSSGRFLGAAFCSHSVLNGHVLIKYGGTRNPAAPPGVDPAMRALVGHPSDDVRRTYLRCYDTAFARMRERFGIAPHRLICNQISQSLIEEIAGLAGVPPERTVQTGGTIGHIGSADLQIGLARLLDSGGVDAPVAIAASTPYVFGAGMLLPE